MTNNTEVNRHRPDVSTFKSEAASGKRPEGFSWKSRGRSFGYAFNGLLHAFKTQHNMWLHSLAAIIAVCLGGILHISKTQWAVILLCIAVVFSLEIVNTAIESLADFVHPQLHPKMGLVKDLAAGAVLIAAVISFIIGCLIFWPPLWALVKG
ncbi:undecaprenol kinase [Arachidicoccus rhizosphaerae]|uniref:Undecaprenol kinase n=1 Tax=Arachidicoccus rhizosphaerae TaxID=551991 RepID=A0A1H3Z6Y0_9BACT|nr:diacylglycerol kinase family protein [Arachidicoccus rhizosphaerae]SEA19529.1 undecaprenol kinase [Arachidicoccus rhizosphaerae]